MKLATYALLQNTIAALLIGVSLHGCSSGSNVWAWGVIAGIYMTVTLESRETTK